MCSGTSLGGDDYDDWLKEAKEGLHSLEQNWPPMSIDTYPVQRCITTLLSKALWLQVHSLETSKGSSATCVEWKPFIRDCRELIASWEQLEALYKLPSADGCPATALAVLGKSDALWSPRCTHDKAKAILSALSGDKPLQTGRSPRTETESKKSALTMTEVPHLYYHLTELHEDEEHNLEAACTALCDMTVEWR